MKRRWKDMTTPERISTAVLTSVQLSLAVSAWADLATRPAEQVNGRKGVWAAVIAINFVGPIAYFAKGRKT